MEASTTIKQMMAGNEIFVPTYQRAYSWDTECEISKSPKQVNTFLTDLEDYYRSKTESKYYFGHFLYEEKETNKFGVIDGQQRLTTIIIFLSVVFNKIKQLRPLNEAEQNIYEDIIKKNSTYRFETVDYDDLLFKDYVINKTKKNADGLETESTKRIVKAYNFFVEKLSKKEELYLLEMLKIVEEASCTTHHVKDESEAIQMFIFQNNRGKKPSNLEIIKAQFMFHVHLHGGEEKISLLKEIKSRFEKIYKSISSIEYNINEDDVLVYTLRIYFNSLSESNAIEKINKLLLEGNSISFIKKFTHSLALSFEHLTSFFLKDQRENIEVHSLISLGDIGIALPFVIKAYTFGLPKSDLTQLCSSLQSLVIRHRLIGTRADITSRLNGDFQNFKLNNPTIKPIVDRIEWMKNVGSDSWWWSYWNNKELERVLQGSINHSIAKFLLWKYENHLESQGKNGYLPTRFDNIINPELEHIAPQTENPQTGYDSYDEEFINQHINCIGNYLLLSKSHNCSVGNQPFKDKRASYIHLKQQREIQEMTNEDIRWTKENIMFRKNKIIEFILKNQ